MLPHRRGQRQCAPSSPSAAAARAPPTLAHPSCGARAAAECFDITAQRHIIASIELQHGSVGAFTIFLKLRFLLDPLNYAGDIKARTRPPPPPTASVASCRAALSYR